MNQKICEFRKILTWLAFVSLCMSSITTYADTLVMALSPQDNRAVIQNDAGKMQVLSPGDKVDGSTVLQILSDKLVLRDAQGEMVWLFKSKNNQPSVRKVFSTSLPKKDWPKQMQIDAGKK